MLSIKDLNLTNIYLSPIYRARSAKIDGRSALLRRGIADVRNRSINDFESRMGLKTQDSSKTRVLFFRQVYKFDNTVIYLYNRKKYL